MRPEIPGSDNLPSTPSVTMQVYGHGTYMVDADLDGLERFATLLQQVGDDAQSARSSVGSITWNLPISADALSPGTSAKCVASAGYAAIALTRVAFKANLLANLTRSSAQTYSTAEQNAAGIIRNVPRAEFDAAMLAFGVGQACNSLNPADIPTKVALEGPEVVKWAVQAITDGSGGHYTQTMGTIDSTIAALFPDRGKIVTTLSAGPGSATAQPATSIADGAQRIQKLYEHPENAAHIQIQQNIDPVTNRTSWLILLPGTSPWSLNAKNPLDLTGNLTNAAGRASAIEQAAWTALADAKRRAGDTDNSSPVMIEGHSQGGMAATNMAIHAKQKGIANVVVVVTFGSPVGVQKVPAGVNTMNVRQHDDTVPDLAGVESGDHDPNRTVVVLNDPQSLFNDEGKADRVQAHDIGQYGRDFTIAASGASATNDVAAFANSTRQFYSGNAQAYIYDTTRVTPPKRVGSSDKDPRLLNRGPKGSG